jgi:hypothetical protein
MTPAESPISGPRVLLMGEPGTGKTHSLGTLVDLGIEVFVLFVGEGAGPETLLGYWTDRKLPVPENLHWQVLDPPKMTFQAFADQAKRVNTLALDTIAKAQDPDRHLHNQWIKVSEALFNFKDDRTGKSFGPVDGPDWHPGRALVIDGLTGLSKAAMSCVVGARPVWAPGDYQVGQKQVAGFLDLIDGNCRCWFILLAHIEKELDPVAGGYAMTASTIGKALGPVLPGKFSDAVLTTREGTKWTWNTAKSGVAVKARNLPWQDGLPANFKPILEKWLARAAAGSTVK